MQPNVEQKDSSTEDLAAPVQTINSAPTLIQTAPLNNISPNEQLTVPPIKSKKPKKLIQIFTFLFIFLLFCGISYYVGTKKTIKQSTAPTASENAVELSVPKDATVSEVCVDGRGKQYISPQDIPTGPIYDVFKSKIVALEFLVKYADIQNGSEKYMNLKLNGAKYDHIMLMPVQPHAGETEPHFHLIAFMISSEESKTIVCKS